MTSAFNSGLSQSSTSSSLLERAKQHDQEAWETLVKLYAPLVYRECRVMGVPPQDASDVVQDVFRKVSANLSRFQHHRSGDTFRGWLATISRNGIHDYYKIRKHRPRAVGGTDMYRVMQEVPASEVTDSSTSAVKNDNSVVRHAIEHVRVDFKPRTWDAFWKTTVEGRSPADVAEQLGVSIQVVYTARSRVLCRLRAYLEGLLD